MATAYMFIHGAAMDTAAAAQPVASCVCSAHIDLLDTLPQAVDLVLADVRMPHVSGPELGRVLARTRPDLPVIYRSSSRVSSPSRAANT